MRGYFHGRFARARQYAVAVSPANVPLMFLPSSGRWIRLGQAGGLSHGGACCNGGLRRDRGASDRRPGPDRQWQCRLHARRSRRQGGRRIARKGAGGVDCLGPRAAGPPAHRQSGARRRAEGGQPLRPAHRARRDGGDRGDPGGCLARIYDHRRTGARRDDHRRRRRAARRRCRQCPRTRPDLPGRLRPGSGLGVARHRHSGAALADPARQSFRRHASDGAAGAGGAAGRRAAARSLRHQGPGKRQAGARNRRRRRSPSAHVRPAGRRQVDAGGAAALDPAAAHSRASSSKSRWSIRLPARSPAAN